MKVTFIQLVILSIVISMAQAQICRPPPFRLCTGPKNEGVSGWGCRASTNWWFNGVACLSMNYRGCGGNNNRFCSRAACERRCRRN